MKIFVMLKNSERTYHFYLVSRQSSLGMSAVTGEKSITENVSASFKSCYKVVQGIVNS